MSLHNSESRWGWPAKALHWIIAVLMIGLFAAGTYMTRSIQGWNGSI